MADSAPTTRRELEAQISDRARRDSAFRDALRRDARAALAREFDLELPDDLDIQVLEETASVFYLVLPIAPAPGLGQELTDAELESVAAGRRLLGAPFWLPRA